MEHVGCRRLREAREVYGSGSSEDGSGDGRFLDVEEDFRACLGLGAALVALLRRGAISNTRELDSVKPGKIFRVGG
jgi:hypothetical protein